MGGVGTDGRVTPGMTADQLNGSFKQPRNVEFVRAIPRSPARGGW